MTDTLRESFQRGLRNARREGFDERVPSNSNGEQAKPEFDGIRFLNRAHEAREVKRRAQEFIDGLAQREARKSAAESTRSTVDELDVKANLEELSRDGRPATIGLVFTLLTDMRDEEDETDRLIVRRIAVLERVVRDLINSP